MGKQQRIMFSIFHIHNDAMLFFFSFNLIILGWVCPTSVGKSPPTSETFEGANQLQDGSGTQTPPGGPPLTADDDLTSSGPGSAAESPSPPSFLPPARNRTVMRFVREPQSQLVRNGAPAELTCAVTVTGVTIQWLFKGKPVETNRKRKYVRQSDGALVFTKVRRNKNDEGTYQCKVLSSEGALLSLPAKLTIARMARAFNVSPSDQAAPAGGAALLRCGLSSVPPARIVWLRDGEPLPVNGSERLSADVAGQLSIRPVTEQDAGDYSCMAYNDVAGRQRRSESGTLQVTPSGAAPRQPVLLSPPLPERSTVRANSSLVLPCVADGHPLPAVSWTRQDGVPVPTSAVSSGGSLRLTSASPDDAATYICTASNEAGQVSQETTVVVLVPPVLTSKLSPLLELPRGRLLRLRCSATGLPSPVITWIKDGHRVRPDAGRVRTRPDGSLVIGNLQSVDAGIYQCVAYSSAGYVAAAVHLATGTTVSAIQMRPPTGLRVFNITSRSAGLSWTVDDDAALLAYTAHYRALDSVGQETQEVVRDPMCLLNNLRPFTNYSVYVRAYSTQMASDPSETVTFRTAEDVPSHTPRVTLVAVSPTELNVSWEALPPSLSNGIITGYRINSQRHNDPATATMVEVDANRHYFLITGLEPGRAYDVRVLAATRVGYQNVTSDGYGDAQWVRQRMPQVSGTPVSQGPRPPSVHLVVSNHTTILISWEMPPTRDKQQAPPVGFNVLYRRQEQAAELIGPIRLPADTFQHYLTGLVPDTWYEVHVQTVAADHQTAEAIKTISTLPAEQGVGFEPARPVLEPPVGLHAEPLNATAVLFRWQRPPSSRQIQYFTVKYRQLGGDTGGPVMLSSTDLEVTVTGLQPFTYYEFTVRSHDAADTYGPYSEGRKVRTLEGAPSPPTNVTWSSLDASRIRVSWRPPRHPHGQISGYHVLYSSDGSAPLSSWRQLDIPVSSGTQMQVSQLVPNQKYWLRVRARTAASSGQLSDVVQFEIKAVLESSTPTPAPSIDSSTYAILTAVLLLLALAAAVALLTLCWRRRRCREDRQRAAANAAGGGAATGNGGGIGRSHLNGPVATGAAAGSDHVEMDVLTPMLTHVPPVVNHQLDSKGGHPPNKPANGRANGFVHPLYLGADRLRRGSDPNNESRVSLINNNSALANCSTASQQPP